MTSMSSTASSPCGAAEHGFRFHDVEVIAPGWPRAVEPDPEHPIRVGQAGRRVGAKGDLELVAEDEVLKCDVATRAEGGKKTADDEIEERKHPAA